MNLWMSATRPWYWNSDIGGRASNYSPSWPSAKSMAWSGGTLVTIGVDWGFRENQFHIFFTCVWVKLDGMDPQCADKFIWGGRSTLGGLARVHEKTKQPTTSPPNLSPNHPSHSSSSPGRIIIWQQSAVWRGAPVCVRACAQRGQGGAPAPAPLELLSHPRPGHHPSPGQLKHHRHHDHEHHHHHLHHHDHHHLLPAICRRFFYQRTKINIVIIPINHHHASQ